MGRSQGTQRRFALVDLCSQFHFCASTYIHVHTYIHTNIHTYMQAYMYIHAYRHTYRHTCIYMHTVHTCIHTYMQAYMYIHAGIHVYTCIQYIPFIPSQNNLVIVCASCCLCVTTPRWTPPACCARDFLVLSPAWKSSRIRAARRGPSIAPACSRPPNHSSRVSYVEVNVAFRVREQSTSASEIKWTSTLKVFRRLI